jgi:5'-deoxynucleotidase YfbR-like HD superfamily hydrolase
MLLTDLEQGLGVKVNGERVLKIATIHDLAESLTFDISKGYLKYLGKRGSAMKNEIETTAWKHLIKGMESYRLSRTYSKLQEEYMGNRTIEAQIVHAADNLDILLQITDLRRRGYPIRLMKDLWDQTLSRLQGRSVRSVRKLLKPIVEENRRLN